MNEELNIIVLKDDNDEEIELEVLAKFDLDDAEYAIVIPADDEVEEAIALRIDKDKNGEEIFIVVEDDEEFNNVNEAYMLLMSEEEE